MKKIAFVLLLVMAIISVILLQPKKENISLEFLRIHIRANSNLESDQYVKYKVKDEIVKLITPYLAECDSKVSAQSVVSSKLSDITDKANEVLTKYGYEYKSNAKVTNEYFPTRSYDGTVLNSGYYDALIVELGQAKGDNWWCVIYPPLCFVDTTSNITYKSKLVEIVNNFFGKG